MCTPTLAIVAPFDRFERAARTRARAGLPSPGLVAARVAVAVFEVEACMRPFGQLERTCRRSLHEGLASGLAAAAGRW